VDQEYYHRLFVDTDKFVFGNCSEADLLNADVLVGGWTLFFAILRLDGSPTALCLLSDLKGVFKTVQEERLWLVNLNQKGQK